MRFVPYVLAIAFLASPFASGVSAQEEEPPAGELHVTMNVAFVKVAVDGAEWSAVEFEQMGKKALIKGLDLAEHEITLTPFEDRYEPETLTVTEDDFKRRRKGRVYYFIATKRVHFDEKPTPEEKPTPDEEPEPDDKPKVVPEPEEDDLL